MNFKIEPRTDRANNGLCPFRLKIGTGAGRQYVALNFNADPSYWDADHEIFIIEKGVKSDLAKERNKQLKEHNLFIDSVKARCKEIMTRFNLDGVGEPTITQFYRQIHQSQQKHPSCCILFSQIHIGAKRNRAYRERYLL